MIRQPEHFPEQVKEVRRRVQFCREEPAQVSFENFCARITKQGKSKHDQV